MIKCSVSIIVFIFLLPVYVLAGEYVLVKGEGMEVCEAYKNNLNSFNLHNKYVMACERKLNPQFTDFQKPEWQKMDLRKNIELLKKIELFLGNWGVVTPDNVKGWEEYIESRIKEEYISIDFCQIDINNDGKKKNVIKYNDGSCPQSHYGAALLVLNDDRTEIDIQKTKPLLQNPRTLKNGPLSEGWDGTMYDIFIYKKKAYFDRWRYGDISSDGKTIINTYDLLRVFSTEPDKKSNSLTREICRYKFRSTK
jgi:hypothetical protein